MKKKKKIRIKNFKILLFLILFTPAFGWGCFILKEKLDVFFFWHEFSANAKIMSAQTAQDNFLQNLKELAPARNKSVEDLNLGAKAVLALFLDKDKEATLLAKNIDKKLAIASLTKLMTAKVILENYDLAKEIIISKEAVAQEEDLGKLTVGEKLPVGTLLYPLLIESSNDAAFALANDYSGMTSYSFLELMNLEARSLGLDNTFFYSVNGLEPDDELSTEINYSTAADLVKLVKDLLPETLLWQILATPQINLYGEELTNTNKLLGEYNNIIGGKTGYTEKAGECFILVLEAPKGRGYLINVILGSPNRWEEMRELIAWEKQAYLW
jgi:D-alanyl-D-alanine carboxypeptidase